MEISSLFISLIKPFLWLLPILIPVLILGAILNSPWFKGKMGERAVRRLIERRLDPSIYRAFSDITIPAEDGTTQIDHIYVCPYGILVIETKNMAGWIYGSRNQAQWTQSIYRKKSRFQNPLRQNYKHVKTLESLLGLPLKTFKSIIVFTGDCTFKTEMPDEVCTLSDLIEYIHSIDDRILSDSQISDICSKIESARLESSHRVHRDHVAHLNRRHQSDKS